jgi:hypothetical protein
MKNKHKIVTSVASRRGDVFGYDIKYVIKLLKIWVPRRLLSIQDIS